MPLFPYLSIIVWMSLIKVMLGATDDDAQSMADPTDVMMNRASIILFPAQVRRRRTSCSVGGRFELREPR